TTASGSKSPGFAVQVVRERPFTRADEESGSRPGGAGEISGLGEMSAGDGVRAPEAVLEEVGAWGELHAPSRRVSPVAAGFSWSMSGVPPPGIRHLATTLRVEKSMTENEPSRRFETYR